MGGEVVRYSLNEGILNLDESLSDSGTTTSDAKALCRSYISDPTLIIPKECLLNTTIGLQTILRH